MSAANHRAAAQQWCPQEIVSDSISGLHYPTATLPCYIMGLRKGEQDIFHSHSLTLTVKSKFKLTQCRRKTEELQIRIFKNRNKYPMVKQTSYTFSCKLQTWQLVCSSITSCADGALLLRATVAQEVQWAAQLSAGWWFKSHSIFILRCVLWQDITHRLPQIGLGKDLLSSSCL